jgi:hypothetical protein
MGGNLAAGEQVLWMHQLHKGIIHREVVEEWVITNRRVFVARKGLILTAVPLIDCNVAVINVRRESSGFRVGQFMTESHMGVFYGTGRTTSVNWGDLLFMSQGREVFRFHGVSDPWDVKRLVETVQRELKETYGIGRSGAR